jgi:hypothetical protein
MKGFVEISTWSEIPEGIAGIYILKLPNGEYIGQSKNIRKRTRTHTRNYEKDNLKISKFFYFACPIEDLEPLENALIADRKPIYNKYADFNELKNKVWCPIDLIEIPLETQKILKNKGVNEVGRFVNPDELSPEQLRRCKPLSKEMLQLFQDWEIKSEDKRKLMRNKYKNIFED